MIFIVPATGSALCVRSGPRTRSTTKAMPISRSETSFFVRLAPAGSAACALPCLTRFMTCLCPSTGRPHRKHDSDCRRRVPSARRVALRRSRQACSQSHAAPFLRAVPGYGHSVPRTHLILRWRHCPARNPPSPGRCGQPISCAFDRGMATSPARPGRRPCRLYHRRCAGANHTPGLACVHAATRPDGRPTRSRRVYAA